MKHHKKLWWSALLVVCIAVVYAVRWRGSSSFREEEYRDTANLMVQQVTWEVTKNASPIHGVLVNGTLVNQDPRSALSVVLVAELRDKTGKLIAANPMVNVLDVPPLGSKPFDALIPAKTVPREAEAVAHVTVVRWGE